MKARPRLALLGALGTAALLNVLTRTSGITWLALGSAAALALPLTSVFLRPRLDRLSVTLLLPARVTAGDVVTAELRIRNGGSTSTPACRWQLDHPGLGKVEAHVPALAAGEETRLPLETQASQRGIHVPGAATVSTAAPYGMVLWTLELPVDARPLVVHPVTNGARGLRGEGSLTASDRSVPVAGAGTEVLGLRPWQQGDSARHVNARASARHGRPVVLERERDSGPSLVVLAVGGPSGPAWERAVSTAASRCLWALREGSPPVVVPAPQRLDAVGLLDAFAGLDNRTSPAAEDIRRALQAAGRGGTMVLLSPHEQVRSAAAAAGVRLEVLS